MKKMFFAALAATMMFASCNKEEINGSNGSQEVGEPTTMGFSFSLPTTGSESRALDPDETPTTASAAENALYTISVYAFKSDGSPAEGSPANFFIADFNENTPGVHTLAENKRIKTTTATSTVYIVANATVGAVTNENDFKSKIADASYGSTTPSTGITMSSGAIPVTLTPQEVNVTPTPSENNIATDLYRVNAKVVVTVDNAANSASFKQTFASDVADAAFEINYTVINWAPGFAAVSTYYVERKLNGKLVTVDAGRTGHANLGSTFQAVGIYTTSAADWANSAIKFHYVGENAPANNQMGEATNVMVRTQASPNRQAVVNSANDGVEWIAAGSDLNAGFVVLKNNYDGKIYFCKDETVASDVANLLPGTSFESAKYINGYVYFLVTLNYDKAPKAVVARNQFVNVNIKGIKDGALGWPGEGVDGLTPPDPETGEFPEPFIPVEPIEEYNTYMIVEVNVKPWAYFGTDVDLQ